MHPRLPDDGAVTDIESNPSQHCQRILHYRDCHHCAAEFVLVGRLGGAPPPVAFTCSECTLLLQCLGEMEQIVARDPLRTVVRGLLQMVLRLLRVHRQVV